MDTSKKASHTIAGLAIFAQAPDNDRGHVVYCEDLFGLDFLAAVLHQAIHQAKAPSVNTPTSCSPVSTWSTLSAAPLRSNKISRDHSAPYPGSVNLFSFVVKDTGYSVFSFAFLPGLC
jgi:hypothetical protein